MSSEATLPRRGRMGRFVLRSFLLVVVPVAVALVALHFYARGGRYVETENAYVKANVIAITPEVSGRVVWVGAQDNASVGVGSPLFRIDAEPFRIAVAEKEANLAITSTQIETLRANYREAVVEEGRANDDVAFLELQLKRQARLRDKRMGSEERFVERHIERRRGAEVEHDNRRAVARYRRHGVDYAVGADLVRILVQNRHPALDSGTDEQRLA